MSNDQIRVHNFKFRLCTLNTLAPALTRTSDYFRLRIHKTIVPFTVVPSIIRGSVRSSESDTVGNSRANLEGGGGRWIRLISSGVEYADWNQSDLKIAVIKGLSIRTDTA